MKLVAEVPVSGGDLREISEVNGRIHESQGTSLEKSNDKHTCSLKR